MNRDCHGDFFLLHGRKLYCCFAGSEIVDASGLNNGEPCPACSRQINAPTAPAEAKIETVSYVALPGRDRIEIAKELLVPPMMATSHMPIKDYYWRLDGNVAVLIKRLYDTGDEPVRYNKESLLLAIHNVKKTRAGYASDEAHQKDIQMLEEGLLVFPASAP